ncbi:hypothetical protein NDU88_008863 [Pleurodeles waltl]|uniref:Uncharacterized protein n=1 Tax=Pleurodeles waltl TaxID=8319 RepID=A0AAV7QU08_PLEWA|nr:hypothetical protein NDU88_008863 [Pleurodeles waltl]
MSAQPVSIVQKQQSNMSEICNEDQEKEKKIDYALDTCSKPDECCKAGNRRQKQQATRRTSTITVHLELSRKNRVLHYTPTENVLVKKAIDFHYDFAFLAAQDSKNFELHSDTRGNKLETEPTTSVEGADFQDIHNDCIIVSCEENEDEDTPGCFNLGSCFTNMRKYFQKKYTRL